MQHPGKSAVSDKPAAPAAGAPRPAGGPGPGGPGGGGVPSVEVARVKTMSLQDDAQAVGSLKSRQSVILRPEVAGRVAELAFADGARVRKGITEWIHGWKAKGWKTAAKQPVKNADLWQKLDALVHQGVHQIHWHWVKGHAGDPSNERADALANRGVPGR